MKLRKLAVPAGLILVGAVLALALCHRKPGNAPSRPLDLGEYYPLPDILKPLYVPAEDAAKPILPDTVQQVAPLVDEAVYAAGTWSPDTTLTPGDTLAVEASAIEGVGGDRWIRVTIDGKPVLLTEASWYERPAQQRRIYVIAEVANVDSSRIGVGAGYRFTGDGPVDVSGAATVAIELDWIAAEARVSTSLYSGLRAGGGIGYRWGRDSGLHLSGGVSLDV